MRDRNVHFKTCIPCVTEPRGVFYNFMEIFSAARGAKCGSIFILSCSILDTACQLLQNVGRCIWAYKLYM